MNSNWNNALIDCRRKVLKVNGKQLMPAIFGDLNILILLQKSAAGKRQRATSGCSSSDQSERGREGECTALKRKEPKS